VHSPGTCSLDEETHQRSTPRSIPRPPPDVEAEQWPAEVIAGRDPQLEGAILEVLRMLEANPPVEPKRLPFPTRVRR
jgi:hypothetical protein